MPALINVGSLLGLLFFMYAVLGVSIFGKVKPHKPLALNHRANFHHFGYAMLMLIRVTTGEGWNDVLRDTMVQPPHCDEEKDECGTQVRVSNPFHPRSAKLKCTLTPMFFVCVCAFFSVGAFVFYNIHLDCIVRSAEHVYRRYF
jgi:hypothetical protein